MVPYDGRFYNYNPVNYIQTPYEKTNVFGSMRMDLTDDIEFKANFRMNDRISSQELAPLPFNSPTDPSFKEWNPWMAPVTLTVWHYWYSNKQYHWCSDPFGLLRLMLVLVQTTITGSRRLTLLVWVQRFPSWTVDENGDPVFTNVGGLAGVPVSDARRRMVETTRRFEQNISQLQFDMTLTGNS